MCCCVPFLFPHKFNSKVSIINKHTYVHTPYLKSVKYLYSSIPFYISVLAYYINGGELFLCDNSSISNGHIPYFYINFPPCPIIRIKKMRIFYPKDEQFCCLGMEAIYCSYVLNYSWWKT